MQNEIKKICQQYGIKPSKSKGQNFLIDYNALGEIVKAAGLTKGDYVLEIGPGLGILTEKLIQLSKKVLSVELDKSLVVFLNKKFKANKNLEILQADILKIKNQALTEKLGTQNYKLVANLPYNITKAVLRKFLSFDPKPQEIVVLVQKEVAQKIVAQPGKMSVLSLSVQFYGQPEIIGYVPKESFYPAPKVESAILKIKLRQEKLPPEIVKISAKKEFIEKKFWQLIKIGFSSPRKQLQNNLAAGFKLSKENVKNKLKSANLPLEIRAQDLSLTDWAYLYQKFMV